MKTKVETGSRSEVGWLVGVKFYEKPPTTQERVVKPKTQRSTVLNYSGMLWMLEKPFAEEL